MRQERRLASLNSVLISLGKIEQIANDNQGNLVSLVERVGIQNGRVKKLENFQSMLMGMGIVLSILVIPIVLFLIQQWITNAR